MAFPRSWGRCRSNPVSRGGGGVRCISVVLGEGQPGHGSTTTPAPWFSSRPSSLLNLFLLCYLNLFSKLSFGCRERTCKRPDLGTFSVRAGRGICRGEIYKDVLGRCLLANVWFQLHGTSPRLGCPATTKTCIGSLQAKQARDLNTQCDVWRPKPTLGILRPSLKIVTHSRRLVSLVAISR